MTARHGDATTAAGPRFCPRLQAGEGAGVSGNVLYFRAMQRSLQPEWTADAVVRAMRLALTAPTSASLFDFVVRRARDCLGENSTAYTALFTRACWQHSHAEPRSHQAAQRVAAALTADGVAMPPALAGPSESGAASIK
jgi:hypothetical protein